MTGRVGSGNSGVVVGWSGVRLYRRLVCVCLAVVCLVLLAGGASASATSYVDGISDQSMPYWDYGFSNPASFFPGYFKSNWINPAPHIGYARYALQWNAMTEVNKGTANYREQFEAWVADAGGQGLILDITLTRYTGAYPGSPGEYKVKLKEVLKQAIAEGHPISYLEPWNEPNSQGKESEVNAAHFANEGNVACKEVSSACAVIAGNVEDSSSVEGYLKKYRENLNFTPLKWGVHPYQSVENMEESYYKRFLEGLPNKGAGEHIWFTEVAARNCTSTKNNGEEGQAKRARWLVKTLIHNQKPEHVFYWEFLYKNREMPTCSETNDALYVPSSDPNAPDAPLPATAFIYGEGQGFPWAYTGAVENVSGTQATLTGSVYPGAGHIHEGGALETKYHFQYGPTTSYGYYSAEAGAGSGFGRVAAGLAVGGLVEGTTYHYRLVAWNSEGTNYGADQTFVASTGVGGGGGAGAASVPIQTSTGELLVFAEDTAGELVAFARNSGGAWSVFNITAVVGGNPHIAGTPTPIITSTGELLVFVEDTAGELLAFARNSGGAWSVFNVSAVISGGPPVKGTVVPIQMSTGELLVFAEDTAGEPVAFGRTTGGAWSVFNITAVVGGNPHIAGTPTPIITSTGELLVFTEDTAGELVAFARNSGGAWSVFNVTAVVSGNPHVMGTVVPIQMSSGELLVFAEDTAGELVAFGRTTGGAWSVFNITAVVSGNPHIAGTPTPIITSTGELLVFTEDTAGELLAFARTTGGAWSVFNVTEVANGKPDIMGTALPIQISTGELLVFAADTASELVAFGRNTGGAWSVFNITAVVSGNPHIT